MATKSGKSQHVVVVRHGERVDHVDSEWTSTASRPYDAPLTDKGVSQAQDTGPRLKALLGKVKMILVPYGHSL